MSKNHKAFASKFISQVQTAFLPLDIGMYKIWEYVDFQGVDLPHVRVQARLDKNDTF